MGLKSWVRQRVSLVAGQAQSYEPRIRTTNALYIINNSAAEVRVGPSLSVANEPEATIKPSSNGPVPLSAPGELVYLYCASAVNITVVEITTDDLAVVFAMQVVISDISSAVDVSDRAARAVGKAGIQVGGSDVTATNRVPTTGRSLTPRTAVRAALAAGATATVWTPALGLRIRLATYHVTTSAVTVLTVRLGGQVIWERDFSTAGGADVTIPQGGILGAVDGALIVTTSAAATVGAYATGTEE